MGPRARPRTARHSPGVADRIHRLPTSAVLLWLAASAYASAAELRFGGSAALSSDYVLRGVTQSRGHAAAQLDLHIRPLEDWTVGAWASSVEFQAGRPFTELNLYTQWRWLLPRALSATAGAVYYAYPGDPRTVSYQYAEINSTLRWRDRLTLSATWAPRTVLFAQGYRLQRDHNTWSAELTGNQPLPLGLVALAGIGYFDAPGLPAAGYAYGSAGLMRRFGRWRAEVDYMRVQDAAHRRFTSGAAGGPLTVSVALLF